MASTYIYDYVKFRPHFDTLADLTADTSLAYAATGNKYRVDVGDYVTAGTQSYVVISSGGTAHETTAGGVKLYEAGPAFSTRARLINWYGEGYTVPDGTIFSAAGVYYEAESGNTSIGDLNGWKTLFDSANAGAREFVIAVTDSTTAISGGAGKRTFRMPHAMTLTEVRASLVSACSTGTFTVDINEGGTSILSTKLTIDATEKTSTTAATPAVISDASLADNAEITIDVDDSGDGTAVELSVAFIGSLA